MSFVHCRQILSPFILIQNTIMGISHLDMLQHYVLPILQDEGLVEVMLQQDGTLPTFCEADASVLEHCVSTEMERYWEIKALATKFTCHASTLFSLGMYQFAYRHVMSADIPESRQRIQMALESVTTEMLTNM